MSVSDEQRLLLRQPKGTIMFALFGALAGLYLGSRIAGGRQMSASDPTSVTDSQKPSEKPPDEQAFLQAMYKEYCDRLRQNETLRQQSTTLVFALSGTLAAVEGALLAFAAKPIVEVGLQWTAAPLFLSLFALIGVFVAALGVLGRSLNIKHSERVEVHERYSRAYRRELDKIFGTEKYQVLRRKALKEHEREWPYGKRRPGIPRPMTYEYWVNINWFLIILGGIMALIPLIVLLISVLMQISWVSQQN